MKRRILFVDDEQNVLSGLRRMLRALRNEYEFSFAEGGKEALALMDEHHFDLVVSDMRMPGMDGAELLRAVKERSPATIRVVLSGQADVESICRTVGVAHQYLSKPCDSELLTDVLKRACALQDVIGNQNITSVIAGVDSLPSLPKVYHELQLALHKPEVSVGEIGALIERDMAMAAKILQLVNSSFFGLYKKVETPARAVMLLGIDTVKMLILGVEIFSQLPKDAQGLPINRLFPHSLAVAQCAKRIAESETMGKDFVGSCLVAGLVHDIGKLVLITALPEEYRRAISLAQTNKMAISSAEEEVFGTTQNSIGAYLVGLWGFARDILEAVAFNNQLHLYCGRAEISAALIVHVANTCYYLAYPEELLGREMAFDLVGIAEAGCADKLPEWQAICQDYLQDLAD